MPGVYPRISAVGFDVGVSLTKTAVQRETARRLRHLGLQLGDEMRRLRLEAHVSIAAVSRATGIHAAHLGRIETGEAHPSAEVLIAVGVALGADLSIKYFPGSGPRIHDRFQAPMIEALLGGLGPRWRAQLEVPIGQPRRGVIDLILHDQASGLMIVTEVQSDLQRLEQQIRWGHEKAAGLATSRVGATAGSIEGAVSELLVLRSTVRTRDLARQYEATLRAAFPARTTDAYRALTGQEPWPGPAVVWMHAHGTHVTVMRLPPAGVALGR